MIAISSVEVSGKKYLPGATLPVLSKADEKFLLDGGYAKADPVRREKPRKKGKADDVSGSGKR